MNADQNIFTFQSILYHSIPSYIPVLYCILYTVHCIKYIYVECRNLVFVKYNDLLSIDCIVILLDTESVGYLTSADMTGLLALLFIPALYLSDWTVTQP